VVHVFWLLWIKKLNQTQANKSASSSSLGYKAEFSGAKIWRVIEVMDRPFPKG
jgi:hypothetical protein